MARDESGYCIMTNTVDQFEQTVGDGEGQRSQGCSPGTGKELEMTEQLSGATRKR